MSDAFNKVLEALLDYQEARKELDEARGEYTGYSPSYHLHSWYEREEKSKAAMEAALNSYIDERIAAAQPVERGKGKP